MTLPQSVMTGPGGGLSGEIARDLISFVHDIGNTGEKEKVKVLRSADRRIGKLIDAAAESADDEFTLAESGEKSADFFLVEMARIEEKAKLFGNDAVDRSSKFSNEILVLMEKFNGNVDTAAVKYKQERDEERARHASEMARVQGSLDDLDASFSEKLQVLIAKCTEDHSGFQVEYDEVSGKWTAMKNELEKRLGESEESVCSLEKTIKEMEEVNVGTLAKLKDEYETTIEQETGTFLAELKEAEQANQKVNEEIESFRGDRNTDRIVLRRKIERIRNKNSDEIQEKVQERQKEIEERINEMNEVNREKEMRLADDLQRMRDSNTQKLETMRTGLEQLKERARESEASNAERLKVARLHANQSITELDAKIRKINTDQQGVLDLTRKRYLIDLKGYQRQAEQTMWKTRQRLTQLQQQFDQQKKQLESEITVLIRVRNRLRLEMDGTWSGQGRFGAINLDFDKERIVSNLAPTDDNDSGAVWTVNGMVQRFKKVDKRLEEKMIEFRELKNKCEGETRVETERINTVLEKEKARSMSLEDDIRLLRIRKAELETKVKTQTTLMATELRRIESESITKVAVQRDSVRQFHEEIQKIGIDESNKKELAAIHALHRNELKELEAKIEQFDEIAEAAVDKATREFEARMASDREKTRQLISTANNRLDDAIHRLLEIKVAFEDSASRDQVKWRDLRKDIVKTNMQVVTLLEQKEDGCSRPASNKSGMNSQLPRLGKDPLK